MSQIDLQLLQRVWSKWIIDLTYAVSQRVATALMRNAKKTLKVSLSICRLYVTISSAIQV